MRVRVYIAGPMTGYENFNREAFHKAEEELKREGHTVLNPAVLPDGLTQPHYMDICMAMIRCVDAIYMLNGWQRSAGAKAELALAEKLGHAVIYQELTMRRFVRQHKTISRRWRGIRLSRTAQMLNGIVMRLLLRLSVTSVIGKRILSLICWMDWKKQNHNSKSSVSITKALSLMGASVLLNWKRGKFNYRLATTFDMDTR